MNPTKNMLTYFLGESIGINSLDGYHIVFTGFHDPVLEQKLKNKGALIYPTITDERIDLVISKDFPDNITICSAKIKLAIQNSIPILSKLSIENWITN